MNRNFAVGCVCIAMASLIFSTMEVILKLPAVAVSFHPIQITMERFLVGGLCLLPLVVRHLKKKGIRLSRRDLAFFALTGLVNIPLATTIYQFAITLGQANVVAVIFSGNPIFVTLLAGLLLHETIHWNNLAALVFEVLGILAILDLFGSGGNISLPSVGLTILSALLFALYSVLGKRKTAKFGSLVVTCCSFFFGSAELALLMALGHTGPGQALYQGLHLDLFCNVPFLQGINASSLPYFLFIGIVNCAAGYVFHMLAIEKTSAIYGSLVFFFKPILAPLFALFILGEAITTNIALGIVLFLAGSLVSILPEFYRTRAFQPRLHH